MNNKPSHSRFSSASKNNNKPISFNEFDLERVDEQHVMVMVVLFFASAFTIVPYYNDTLITPLEASKWFVAIGLFGFILSYLVRKKFRLSIVDGLFYNLFGTAPIGLAIFLVVNGQCTEVRSETHLVMGREHGGSGYTMILEGNALEDYWHIRALEKDEMDQRSNRVKYTFCEGLLGYRFMQDRELIP